MSDMNAIIQPKSDQLNADSLLAGPITIKIAKVVLSPGTDQPCSVFYEGDGGKPYKPCKSMAKLMTIAWGPDSKQYAGKSMTLYRDEKVKWAGMEVGGIRVSHMSHLNGELVTSLTASKGNYKPFRVKPLKAEVTPIRAEPKVEPVQTEGYDFDGLSMMVAEAFVLAEGATGSQGLKEWWETMKPDRMKAGAADRARAIEIADMVKAKIAELETKEGEV